MEISYQCGQCGRWYTANQRSAGKTVKCKDCGAAVKIPPAPDGPEGDLDFDDWTGPAQITTAATPSRGSSVIGPMSPAPQPRMGAFTSPREQAPKSRGFLGSGMGTVVVLVLLALRVYFRWERNHARQARPNHQPVVAAPLGADPPGPRPDVGPWKMPSLPPPPRATEIEPGVMLSEITLRPDPQAGGSMAGHSGKLWLYLPSGDHAPQTLPCILIAGAGSNLITGMDLGRSDRREHLPYARAGFAVLAYELDGRMPENAKGNLQVLIRSSRAFLRAQAGLVNARVAIEYATTRVPAVDPRRLYAVGHSSAGTLALLVAENEPRIAACVAFAPAVDLTLQYQRPAQKELAQLIPGAGEFFTRFNPRANEANLDCPLFLFYADDDARFASQVRDLGTRLEQPGKNVTVSSVPAGGHYESMIKVGVPRAIKWLQSLPKAGG